MKTAEREISLSSDARRRQRFRAPSRETEKSANKVKLIVSLIKHEPFSCQATDSDFIKPRNSFSSALLTHWWSRKSSLSGVAFFCGNECGKSLNLLRKSIKIWLNYNRNSKDAKLVFPTSLRLRARRSSSWYMWSEKRFFTEKTWIVKLF